MSSELLVIFLVPALVIGLLIYGTFAKNRWGINGLPVACPGCKTPQSFFRWPTSLKQALWGGHSSPKCHRELDKWGREISA